MVSPHSAVADALVVPWRRALEWAKGGRRNLSVLYSGGLDSSLVAWGLKDLTRVELVTIGTRASSDLTAGEEGARLLDLPWTGHTIEIGDVVGILQKDQSVLLGTSSLTRAVLVSMALALDVAETDHVVCGQGADELFLGYAHYRNVSERQAIVTRREDLERLIQEDWPRTIALAQCRNKSLTSPFLEPTFLASVRALRVDELRVGAESKAILRELASNLGLPEKLARRPKKAFQYGSGVDRILRSTVLRSPHPGSAR